jgi:hypothetical protein
MFEYLTAYVGREKPPNRFWPVSAEEIRQAEAWIGYRFPAQLRRLFREVGCGFLARGVEDRKRDPSIVNGVLSPREIAELLNAESDPRRPPEGWAAGVMPFFDVGERTFLVMLPESPSPDRVWWPDGQTEVAPDLDHFLRALYRRADFYRSC